MVNFGNTLKALRLKAGMTQKQLAEKLGVTKSIVSYYELHERTPSPDMLIKISSVFHVTTDYLLGVEKNAHITLDISDLSEDDIQFLQSVVAHLRKRGNRR